MDPIHFKVSIDVSAKSESVVTAFCVQHLKQRGFNFTEPHEKWETPTQFKERIGRPNHKSFLDAVALWIGRGKTLMIFRGPTGRIQELCSNADFDAFCQRNKSPKS